MAKVIALLLSLFMTVAIISISSAPVYACDRGSGCK